MRLEREGTAACPAGSRIGRGSSLVDARPIIDSLTARIDVYNGRPTDGRPTFLFLARTTDPVRVTIVLRGVLRKTTGRYGYRMTIPVPALPTVGENPDASIVDFDVDVAARTRHRGRTVHLLQASTSCPRGGFPFQGTFGYLGGLSLTVNEAISCTLESR